jgi:hypothetical protein
MLKNIFLMIVLCLINIVASLGEASEKKRAINQSIDNFFDLIRAYDNLQTTITNVYHMERRNLSSAELNQEYWSYHSLPVYRGGSANRYNHKHYSSQLNWNDRLSSFISNPAEEMIRSGQVDELSSIEKYELIIGEQQFPLTLNEWSKGREYMNRSGVIPSWVGACHGTAPASLNHPRPVKAINVLSSNGQSNITFYPSDIKALLAHAWTTNGGPSAVMGSRCNEIVFNMVKSCYDTNPGSFHLALTNLIGIHQKPLIIDTDPGQQVWNRPVISYKFSYFNPQSRNYTRSITNAIIDSSRYLDDPYKAYRAAGTKKIVGVRSEIVLIDDTDPNSQIRDNPGNDKKFTLVYSYDLELDENGEILGGMWHQARFPDFVWVVADNNLPLSQSERWYSRIHPTQPNLSKVPASLRELALESRKEDQVSFWLIDYLLRLSILP